MERTTGAARTNSNGVTTFHDAAGARRPRRRHQPRQRRQHAQRAVEPAGLSPKPKKNEETAGDKGANMEDRLADDISDMARMHDDAAAWLRREQQTQMRIDLWCR
jgi:hypothetical protein